MMKIKLDRRVLQPEYLRRWFDKYKYPILICLAGLILLLWPGGSKDAAEDPESTTVQAEDQTKVLEAQMEELFSKISGVGKTKVLLTVKSSQENVYAYDTDSKITQKEDELTQSQKSQLILMGSGSSEAPVVAKTQMPEFLGAVVVCEGADSAKVCLQLTEAVRSLTGITADNIVISKMQN